MDSLNLILVVGISGIVLLIANTIGKAVKLPVTLFYIFAGILVSFFIDIEKISEPIFQFGLIILFFYIGMDFNIEKVIKSSKKIYKTGLIDIFFNFFVIFGILILLDYNFQNSFGIAGITFASSSAITTKIIIDKRRIANPETDLILSLMVFEDIFAPILLAVITGFSTNSDPTILNFLTIFLKIAAAFGVIILISKLFAKKIGNFISLYISDEIVVIFVLSGMLLFAGLTYHLHLSEALGSFLFGIFIAETGKSFEFEKMLLPIRDFAIALFFLTFGAVVISKPFPDLSFISTLLIIVIASIIGKYLTGYFGGKLWGLSSRRSKLAGLSIISRGEFSIAILKTVPDVIYPLSAIYTLTLSVFGILFSTFADKIIKKKRPVIEKK